MEVDSELLAIILIGFGGEFYNLPKIGIDCEINDYLIWGNIKF